MNAKEKYQKYCEMYNSISEKIQLIKDYCKANDMTIYKDIVFISVANEERDEYFVDYEYSSPRTPYKRVYGNIPQAQFDKIKMKVQNGSKL